MLCAKLGHWPFGNPPHAATLAQVNLLTQGFLELTPDDNKGKGNKSPHGALDKRTARQWKKRFKRDDDGRP